MGRDNSQRFSQLPAVELYSYLRASMGSIRLALRAGITPASPRGQYVARPPDRSNTAPVVNEFSSEASHATIDAISFTSTKRPRGIFESM